MKSLLELGSEYGTDKFDHGYLPHYEEKFSSLRGKDVTLLEIGILNFAPAVNASKSLPGGASLRMWRDYFQQGMIYGIDSEKDTIFSDERICCFLGFQQDVAFLRTVVKQTGPLDIVVDDGSHRGVHHVASFCALWPFIKPGGWYCIEDAQSIDNDAWTQPLDFTMVELLQPHLRNVLGEKSDACRIDVIARSCHDGLIFIQKRMNPENKIPLSEMVRP